MNVVREIRKWCRPLKREYKRIVLFFHVKKEMKKINGANKDKSKKIFYLGITEHSNLGDLAQFYCIRKWIKENYSEYSFYMFEATTVVHSHFNFVDKLKKIITSEDIIIFQSGYMVQDLGGCHNYMHRLIADALPDANILMMPQTVFFREEQNRKRTADSYNKCKNLLFLARDKVSFQMAKQMFPDVRVNLYPDIVTSLIGYYSFDFLRDKILICRRNDGEKYYSDAELDVLKLKLETLSPVVISDTKSNVPFKKLRDNIEYYIEEKIKEYAHYKLIITDRYHGTIFSLVANTPVIIIKTNDHKVVTGADWFKDVYPDYVQVADSLENAYEKALDTIKNKPIQKLSPYFKEKYYGSVLRNLFEEGENR